MFCKQNLDDLTFQSDTPLTSAVKEQHLPCPFEDIRIPVTICTVFATDITKTLIQLSLANDIKF